jgi:hypothetical protein
MRRARHQKGSLQRVKRKSGEAVWIFRWYTKGVLHTDNLPRLFARWRSHRLADVKAVQVEQWLKSLPVSRGTKAKFETS